jgi:hypothetical protein
MAMDMLPCRHVYRDRRQPEFAAAILLRESHRQNGKVHKRTLCNLSNWRPATAASTSCWR